MGVLQETLETRIDSECTAEDVRFWHDEYKGTIDPVQHEAEVELSRQHENVYESWLFGVHSDYAAHIRDEYEIYCGSGLEKGVKSGTDAIAWWSEQRQRQLYPNLHRMALDILTIPAMSAEPEHLFSETKKIISSERHSLLPSTIEAIEGIKSFNL
jgi:hypothetical protein